MTNKDASPEIVILGLIELERLVKGRLLGRVAIAIVILAVIRRRLLGLRRRSRLLHLVLLLASV